MTDTFTAVPSNRNFAAAAASDRRFAVLLPVLLLLAVATLTRLLLVILHWSQVAGNFGSVLIAFLLGIVFDVFVALVATLPMAAILLSLSSRVARWRLTRWLHFAGLTVFVYLLLYLAAVELFFFDEFNSRFNYVAVDYLLYPHEVFINIWDSYPVLEVLIGVLLATLVIVVLLRRRVATALAQPTPRRKRLAFLVSMIALVAAGAVGLNINLTRISPNRVVDEIAGNGYYSFFYAAFTNQLDYDAYYTQIDESEARRRLQALTVTPDARFNSDDNPVPLARTIDGGALPIRANIVLVLEESLGSEFSGLLHPDGPHCTPQLDSLAQNGMLFTQIYATGNRTVRGLEASLLSFPPIPGQSIVKRPGSEGLFSLPALLREQGYHTVFLYGGRSFFDNFGHFAATNGFETVIDQTDIAHQTFSTIWGVCDGDLFDKTLSVLDSLHTLGGPFFATLITVSNHKPYTYPAGVIPFDPEQRTRENAVRYADFALGKFIRDARTRPYFDSTIFVILGDHGARVYGSQQIPFPSYEIPILFYAPALIPSAQRIDLLASQMDLAPTLLDLLHFSYQSRFFGRSIFRIESDRAMALISHNRDVALLRNDTLAVLGIRQDDQMFRRNQSTLEPLPLEPDAGILRDAIAYYQTAFHLFATGRLRL